ncbi:MAG: 2,3-diketo-L-gulonate-binding periplasmic protein YiaO precursor [Spirochaetes bacterium ADurb.Bin110]|nr:MAG: 2,3-diketo-L-gulonate-binding periplasmic protein YiaO precursor [Spirochaetes bacterium ADurb.Bin110]
MRKKAVLYLIALLIFLSTSYVSAAPYKAELRIASSTAMEHIYNVGAQYFAKLVEERTGGRIKFKLYPDGQLGKGERELLEGIQQGSIDIYVGSTGPLGGFVPAVQALDIPFLFRDYSHVDKVLDGPIGQNLIVDVDKAQMKGLAFWENGFRNLTNSKKVIKTPADAKGLKIRTMENPVHIQAWKSVGVIPTPMAWSEVFGALQQGVIDGQENPIAVILQNKVYEVQKYLSLTQHVYSPAMLIMSAKRWAEIPAEDQQIILQAAKEGAVYERKINRDNEEKMISELASKGMVITRDVDKTAWVAAMKPAFDAFSAQFGKDRIDAILNTK